MARFPPVGRCIYCPETKGLTDEHIIPLSLGGRLVLPDASCETCRKVTSKFEQVVARQMYWPLRLRLGFLGSRKRKKKRPTHWPAIVINGEDETTLPIEVGKWPTLYSTVRMPPPGILSGLPPSETSPAVNLTLKGSHEEIAQLARELGAKEVEIEHTFHWGPFCQLLAKVAHSFSVAHLGLDSVDYFLPSLVVGGSPYFSHYLGGIGSPSEALQHPQDLSLSLGPISDEPHVIVRMTLFGAGRFPTYQAVCGRVTDLDSILRKIALAAQR